MLSDLVGAVGFEPTHVGIKTRCLTSWLRPILATERAPKTPRKEIRPETDAKGYAQPPTKAIHLRHSRCGHSNTVTGNWQTACQTRRLYKFIRAVGCRGRRLCDWCDWARGRRHWCRFGASATGVWLPATAQIVSRLASEIGLFSHTPLNKSGVSVFGNVLKTDVNVSGRQSGAI